jgi:hypothetical protein
MQCAVSQLKLTNQVVHASYIFTVLAARSYAYGYRWMDIHWITPKMLIYPSIRLLSYPLSSLDKRALTTTGRTALDITMEIHSHSKLWIGLRDY